MFKWPKGMRSTVWLSRPSESEVILKGWEKRKRMNEASPSKVVYPDFEAKKLRTGKEEVDQVIRRIRGAFWTGDSQGGEG